MKFISTHHVNYGLNLLKNILTTKMNQVKLISSKNTAETFSIKIFLEPKVSKEEGYFFAQKVAYFKSLVASRFKELYRRCNL